MFARRQSNRLFSTLEQRLRTSRALMLHFFYPPCTSRENWDRWRDIFARRHANRLSLGRQQHQQVSSGKTLDLLLSAPYVTRNLGGESMAFSSSMKIFYLMYVPGMHVVVFTRSSVARALASTPICCNILQYTKRTKPSADT